ncbi:MAG: hypothetical protein IBJ11_04555 [Phycisphaerales bacterium]|nr:hypothetical protein [Phycisphaerales bacterium]
MAHQHDHHHHTTADLEHDLHEHDEWFRHDPNEPHHQETHGKLSPLGISLFLLVTVLFVAATAGVLVQYLNRTLLDERYEQEQVRGEKMLFREKAESFAGWEKSLHGRPEWVDPKAGTIRIPVELARQKVLGYYADASKGGGR